MEKEYVIGLSKSYRGKKLEFKSKPISKEGNAINLYFWMQLDLGRDNIKLYEKKDGKFKKVSSSKLERRLKELEKKIKKETNDPWDLLYKEFDSEHCKDKKAKVIMYDHTGAIRTKCDCGAEYWHHK